MQDIFLLLISLMVCVTVHEAAHAWVAYKLGDPTPKVDGRISLNPARHLDPVGTLFIFLIHFGWGRPVVFNPHNLANPRRDSAIIAVAGPFSNLLTALLVAVLLKYLPLPYFLETIFQSIYWLSIVLLLFNLIPIAPLDGSKFLGLFIPISKEAWYEHYLARGHFYLIALIIGDRLIQQASGFSFLGRYIDFGYLHINALIQLVT